LDDFCMLANRVASHMSKWFDANKLTLNLVWTCFIFGANCTFMNTMKRKVYVCMHVDKTNVIKFITKNYPQFPISIWCDDKHIEESVHTKFLGLQIDSHLNWKTHIDQLVSKLIGACYAVRSLLHVSNTDTLKLIYFAYFHSLIKYGIIFYNPTTIHVFHQVRPKVI
jgi:hypothetical protein